MGRVARMLGSAGTAGAAVHSVKACVVFDAATGAVHHVHRVVTMEGAQETPDDEMKRDALRYAADRLKSGVALPGRRTASPARHPELEALHVDPEKVDLNRPHRVDPRTRTLIPIER